MKKKMSILIVLIIAILFVGGIIKFNKQNKAVVEGNSDNLITVTPTTKISKLEDGLSVVSYEGDYGFESYLKQGGASTDREVISFLKNNVLSDADLSFMGNIFGCSTISVSTADDEKLFGRNFDWNNCDALIVQSKPNSGYSSISTVNMDFIKAGTDIPVSALSDNVQTIAALYAPLDGMNEKGLCVAVNMIQDSDTINQSTDKADITTTTAIRLLLDKAADVDEAVDLLEKYDMHASMGMMIHLAVSDAKGRSVAIEYINNEMFVTNTPVLTNFYITEGEKYGIGTSQSHERFSILQKALSNNETMDIKQMRDVLDSVSKHNFNEFESTEWSIVFNKTSGEVVYYHRENYEKGYTFKVDRS